MSKNAIEILEQQELIQKLIDAGYGKVIDALLLNETKSFTRSGRVNKSGMCRVLGYKTKQLEDTFEACREILKGNFELD